MDDRSLGTESRFQFAETNVHKWLPIRLKNEVFYEVNHIFTSKGEMGIQNVPNADRLLRRLAKVSYVCSQFEIIKEIL